MVDTVNWGQENDKQFVEAIHSTLRSLYGQLAHRASARGERPGFDREFERIRVSLMRAKNRQSVRAELADLFARGRMNRQLQENWPALLGLFAGPDWQRARDLALLALASYSGDGAAQLAAEDLSEGDSNEEEVE